MNWQVDSTYYNYAKAITFLRYEGVGYYKNLIIAKWYSRGLRGKFYDNPAELLDDNGLENKYDHDSILNMLNEDLELDIEENAGYAEKIKQTIEAFKAAITTQDKDSMSAYPAWGDTSFEFENFDNLCVADYLSDSMGGHSFNGTIEEAIGELKKELTDKDKTGISKSTWEIVDWCSKQHRWDNIDDDDIKETLIELLDKDETLDGYQIVKITQEENSEKQTDTKVQYEVNKGTLYVFEEVSKEKIISLDIDNLYNAHLYNVHMKNDFQIHFHMGNDDLADFLSSIEQEVDNIIEFLKEENYSFDEKEIMKCALDYGKEYLPENKVSNKPTIRKLR